jgi:hypothetical protein
MMFWSNIADLVYAQNRFRDPGDEILVTRDPGDEILVTDRT